MGEAGEAVVGPLPPEMLDRLTDHEYDAYMRSWAEKLTAQQEKPTRWQRLRRALTSRAPKDRR